MLTWNDIIWPNLLIDACMNKGAEQIQAMERTPDVFQTVLTDVYLKSEVFLQILSFLQSRKYDS